MKLTKEQWQLRVTEALERMNAPCMSYEEWDKLRRQTYPSATHRKTESYNEKFRCIAWYIPENKHVAVVHPDVS